MIGIGAGIALAGAGASAIGAQQSASASRGVGRQIAAANEAFTADRFNTAQTAAAGNNINGFPHRIGSAETDDVFALSHLIGM